MPRPPSLPYYLDVLKYRSDEYDLICLKDRRLRKKLHQKVKNLTKGIYANQQNIKSVYISDLKIELPLTEEEFWKCRKYHMINENHYQKDEKKGICKILQYQHYNSYSGSSSINIFPIKKAPEFLRPMLPDITVLESTFWDFPRMDIIVQAQHTKGWDDQGGLISQTIIKKCGVEPEFTIDEKEFNDWKTCNIKCNRQYVKLESLMDSNDWEKKYNSNKDNVHNKNNPSVKTILHKRTCILIPYSGFLGTQINNAVENSNLKTMKKLMKEIIYLNITVCSHEQSF